MPALKWDIAGQHYFETGVSRVALYPQASNGSYPLGVAWSGVTKISQSPSGADANKYYADNQKYLTIRGAEEFGGTIEAYSYPDEFADCNGEGDLMGGTEFSGVVVAQQPRKSFGLAYETIVGNDTDGIAYGKKLHLVYGASCSPSGKDYESINETPAPGTMSWEFDTVPVNVTGFNPTSHIEIDLNKLTTAQKTAVETALFGKDPTTEGGTDGSDPYLPLPDALKALISGAA